MWSSALESHCFYQHITNKIKACWATPDVLVLIKNKASTVGIEKALLNTKTCFKKTFSLTQKQNTSLWQLLVILKCSKTNISLSFQHLWGPDVACCLSSLIWIIMAAELYLCLCSSGRGGWGWGGRSHPTGLTWIKGNGGSVTDTTKQTSAGFRCSCKRPLTLPHPPPPRTEWWDMGGPWTHQ